MTGRSETEPPTRAPERRPRTWPIAAGALVSAVLTWAIQALAFRSLGPASYAGFMVVWGAVFFQVGVLFGLQQEVTRSVASAGGAPGGSRSTVPVWRSPVLLLGLLLGAGGAAVLIAFSGLYGARVFGDDWVPIVMAVAVAWLLYALFNAVNGALAGARHWGWLGVSMTVEGTLRFVVLLMLLVAGAGLAGLSFGLAAAGLTWLLLMVWSGPRDTLRLPLDRRLSALARSSCQAMVATAAAAILLSGYPVLLSVTAHGPLPPEAGAVIATVVATRAPLLLPLNAFQTVILTRFVAAGRHVLRPLGAILALVASVTVVGFVVGALLGPWALTILYGADYTIEGWLVGALVIGAGTLAMLSVTGVAALALERHALFAVGWVVAAAVATVLLATDMPVGTRTAWALAAGPVAGALVHMIGVRQGPRTAR